MISLLPTVPTEITVHLGPPTENAPNVTVPFTDYIKNVASSEMYPTWNASALRANITAIISYALSRVYTLYYRTRGFDFDITNTADFDRKYIDGRNTFANIEEIVDESITDYVRRIGYNEPLADKPCDNTTSANNRKPRWGWQELADQGYNSIEILNYYYGDDIEIVAGAPISNIRTRYPGTPLKLGDYGDYTALVQTYLNRISQIYPAIPKINPVDGNFGTETEAAVVVFQEVFNLTPDGIVGSATLLKIVLIYNNILELSKLVSDGQAYYGTSLENNGTIEHGDEGIQVSILQHFLSVLHEFYPNIPAVSQTGVYGPETFDALIAFEKMNNLPENGIVNKAEWNLIYRAYAGINKTTLCEKCLFPLIDQQSDPLATVKERTAETQMMLNSLSNSFSSIPSISVTGRADRSTNRAIARFQRLNGLEEKGSMDDDTRQALRELSDAMRYASTTRKAQYPGNELKLGMRDNDVAISTAYGGLTIVAVNDINLIGKPIRSLQTMLREISYKLDEQDKPIPDGIYGRSTVAAVEFIQRMQSLPVTGVTDFKTWNAVVDTYVTVGRER